ncbi:hypothetical protein MVEN_00020500 [Mycena venus]|uniref:Zn(2)-C6 fungal-type domain-containing protein n=1 Tax=Mycena venus TaxID=2733690 RepID=A0A8H6Z6H7_9AGAR|nr:hypothetical protein MVEN_00020500 [Mycena venus]
MPKTQAQPKAVEGRQVQKMACTRCRKQKLRCDRESPCGNCHQVSQECVPQELRPRMPRSSTVAKNVKIPDPVCALIMCLSQRLDRVETVLDRVEKTLDRVETTLCWISPGEHSQFSGQFSNFDPVPGDAFSNGSGAAGPSYFDADDILSTQISQNDSWNRYNSLQIL